jgi:peptide/nickel transport system permease protein
MTMRRYLFQRLLAILPTTAGVLLLTFLLFHVIGGSPAEVVLGKSASVEALAAFDARYGYDRPLLAGRWAALRALRDYGEGKYVAGAGAGWSAPLAYPLPPGRYRLRLGWPESVSGCGPLTVETRPEGSGGGTPERRTCAPAARRGDAKYEFTVPAGSRATGLTVPGAPPARWQLRRATTGWLDSQLGHYVAGLVRGEWGYSTEYGAPVWHVLRDGVGPSLCLTLPVLVLGTVFGLLFGACCAYWRGRRFDRAALLVSSALMSINYVVWVVAGQFLLAYRARLFPVWGLENWTYLLLPVLIGVLSGLGRDIRFYRTVCLDELHRPHVRTALAKGLAPARVMTRHVLRNSLIPVVTHLSLSVPFLFTGSLLLEGFFGIPGLGAVSLNAIHSADMAVVRAVVILGALSYQFVNLLTDLAYAWLDPRVRLA